MPVFYPLVPPAPALAATALEFLTAGLLGRQTLFGDALPVLGAGFGEAPLRSTVAVFLAGASDGTAARDAGRLQLDETVALFFARPVSASLGFDEGLLFAFVGVAVSSHSTKIHYCCGSAVREQTAVHASKPSVQT